HPAVGGLEEGGVAGRAGRAAPLARQVGLVQDLVGGHRASAMLGQVLVELLHRPEIRGGRGAAGPGWDAVHADDEAHATSAGGADDVVEVVLIGVLPAEVTGMG